jgi:hypothetical protein
MPNMPGAPMPAAAPPKPASFLDDWLAKRQGAGPSPAPNMAPSPSQAQPPQFASNPAPQQAFGTPPAQFGSMPPVNSAPSAFGTPASIRPAQSSLEVPMLNAVPPTAAMQPTGPSMPQLSDLQAHATPMQQPKNISSNELDEQEAGKIAEQLKSQLNTPMGPAGPQGGMMPPMFQEEPVREEKRQQDDTIAIDHEGNMTFHEPTPPSAASDQH